MALPRQRDRIHPDMRFPFLGTLTHALGFAALLLGSSPLVSAQDGGAIYKRSCAPCHENGADRAPTPAALRAMSPERVLAAMESGTHDLDGQPAVGRSPASHRGIRHWQVLAHPMDISASRPPNVHPPAPNSATRRSGRRLERLGPESAQHPLSARRTGRAHRQDLRAESEVGFRIPATLDAKRAPLHRQRPHLHREHQRNGLFARRRFRLHPLVFQCRGGVRSAINIASFKSDSGHAMRHSSAAGPSPTRWTPRPASWSGKPKWTISSRPYHRFADFL